MTRLPATRDSHPPRSLRQLAFRTLFCLTVMLWLLDCTAGGTPVFAQNIQFTPSAVSITVPQGGTGPSSVSLNKSDTTTDLFHQRESVLDLAQSALR